MLIAAAALVIEGWTARAEPTFLKSRTYTGPGEHARETYPAGAVAQSNTPGVGNEAAFFGTLSDAALSPTSTIIGKATTIPASPPTTVLEVLIG